MNKKAIFALVALIAIAAALYLRQAKPPRDVAPSTQAGLSYHCPMHPQERSDQPGRCNICGMKLESGAKPQGGAP